MVHNGILIVLCSYEDRRFPLAASPSGKICCYKEWICVELVLTGLCVHGEKTCLVIVDEPLIMYLSCTCYSYACKIWLPSCKFQSLQQAVRYLRCNKNWGCLRVSVAWGIIHLTDTSWVVEVQFRFPGRQGQNLKHVSEIALRQSIEKHY